MRKLERHGHSGTPEYFIWLQMKSRCHWPKNKNYALYGGRGIYVCEEWRGSFLAFLRDMGTKPAGKSLDRIDNDGPYCKANCRWSTQSDQRRNSSTARILTLNGRSQHISDWDKELSLCQGAICMRLKNGWSLERALTTKNTFKSRIA